MTDQITAHLRHARTASLALYGLALVVVAVAVHTFFAYIGHYPYWSIDDGLGILSTSWLQMGRYGDPSVPVESYSGFQRYRGFFLYGPWPFAAGSLLVWLVGFSVEALRSLHLLAALSLVWVARRLFAGLHGAAATTFVAVCVSYAVVEVQWPMVRPDPFVTMFAALLIWSGAHATRTPRVGGWFGCGLASGCGALSHLLGATLIPSSLLMLSGAHVMHARAHARRVDVRAFVTQAAALVAGWVISALMFYGSFGFRFSDHLLHVLKYRSEVTANTQSALQSTSPLVVWAEHYRIASSGVPTAAIVLAAFAFIVATILLIRVFMARDDNATETVALLLPGVAMQALYVTSIGLYPNFHTGYMMLPQLLAVWITASTLYVLIGRVRSLSARNLAVWTAAVMVFALGVRTASGLLRTDDDPRIALSKSWVGIGTYIDEVLGPLPAGAVAWGSAPLAVVGPSRIQLVSLDIALWLMARIPVDQRPALVPDYLVWGHPASMSAVVTPFTSPSDNPLTQLPAMLPRQSFQLGSIVSAQPYAATRVYRRELAPRLDSGLPAVSVWDAAEQRWLHEVVPARAEWQSVSGTLHAVKGSRSGDRIATTAVAADLPEGWYLVRVVVEGDSPDGVLLTAGSGNTHTFLAGDLPSDLDIAARLSQTDPIYLLRHHTSGMLGVNVYAGSAIRVSSVDVFAVRGWPDYRADRDALTSQPLPPLSAWQPDAASGVRAQPDGDRLRVSGNASQYGYQLVSPPISVTPGSQVSIHLPVTAERGRVCIGVLDGSQQHWIVPPTDQALAHRFSSGANDAVVIVVSNCNAASTPTTFVVEPGRYAVQSSQWYVDSLMQAFERAKP